VQLLFVCHALAQAPTSPAGEPLHRFEYPAENFSIGLPATWREIDPATLGRMSSAAHLVAPNAPELRISHGYTSAGAPETGYPWVAVMLTDDQVSGLAFKNLESAQSTVNDLMKRWLDPASGGIIQKAQMGTMSYDKDRHVLWGSSQSVVTGIGDLRTLSAAYVTRAGIVQVHCYAKASEYEEYEPLCRQIIESVTIDPKVAMTAAVPLSQLLGMSADQADTTYRELVARVKGGDFLIDFRTLRFACVRSSHCDPRGKTEDLLALKQAEADHRAERVVEIAERLIEQGFANVAAHATLAKAYADIGKPEQAKFHFDVTTALIRSIYDIGDGKTKETAFEAICRREECAVLAARHLQCSGPGVSSGRVIEGPHQYQKWEMQDPKTQKNTVVFFNVDALAQTESHVNGK
jgi:hypothetical protein